MPLMLTPLHFRPCPRKGRNGLTAAEWSRLTGFLRTCQGVDGYTLAELDAVCRRAGLRFVKDRVLEAAALVGIEVRPDEPEAPPLRPIVLTPATPEDLKAIAVLQTVEFGGNRRAGRFAENIAKATELTDRQRGYLWSLCWHYRRQIGDEGVVKRAGEIMEKARTQ